jgi:hypothetical protein
MTDAHVAALYSLYGVSREQVMALSQADRAGWHNAHPFHRWMKRAVSVNPTEAVKDITVGTLNSATLNSWLSKHSKTLPAVNSYNLLLKWNAVKEQYKGVSLVNNPSNAREKAFYDAYLKLKEKQTRLNLAPNQRVLPLSPGRHATATKTGRRGARKNTSAVGGDSFAQLKASLGMIAELKKLLQSV